MLVRTENFAPAPPVPGALDANSHPIQVIRSGPHRLIYVENTKAASTSIHALFLALAGIETNLSARAAFASEGLAAQRDAAGLTRLVLGPEELTKFAADHDDYVWFSVVRHPYLRTLSNYYSKLSRYAWGFDRGIYWKGKLPQILAGPSAWRSHLVGIRYMHRHLSFEGFVEGLARNGIDFDHHFRLQSRQLRIDTLPYRFLVQLDDFEAGMEEVLQSAGIDDVEAFDIGGLRLNRSTYGPSAHEALTGPIKEVLQRLYRPDFETFGFER